VMGGSVIICERPERHLPPSGVMLSIRSLGGRLLGLTGQRRRAVGEPACGVAPVEPFKNVTLGFIVEPSKK